MKKLIVSFGLLITMLMVSTSPSQAQDHPHKKISSQGQGAIIGGAGGAVAGGLIGHGVKGALIGGALGAGGGYIIGNEHRRHAEKERAAYRAAHRRHHHHRTYASIQK